MPADAIPIKRTQHPTEPEIVAAGFDPADIKRLLEMAKSLEGLFGGDDPAPKKKKQAPQTGGDEPGGSPKQWRILYGLILAVSVVMGALDLFGPNQMQQAQLAEIAQSQSEIQKKQIELATNVASIKGDYDAIERAIVDYIQSDNLGMPVPDSVVVLRDKHLRSR